MGMKVKMEEMTWREIEAALQEGVQTVIIPTASVEQHGPHLPLLTDTLIGERISALIANKLGKTLVAPIIRPGLSSHHMGFPGSFTATPATFRSEIEEECLCLMRHGFLDLIIISTHGGNFAFLESIAQDLRSLPERHGYSARVFVFLDLQGMLRVQHKVVSEKFKIPLEEAGWHADVLETSCMLSICPDLVHMAWAEPGWIGDSKTVWDQLYREGMKSITPNGILGDPRKATREMGNVLLDVLSSWMTEEIRKGLE
jgi:creatinine amidohydrolase